MSIFDNHVLRKFYRLIKRYTEELLRKKQHDVEDVVDSIDSRMSRTKLMRREWHKIIKEIQEWNASRIKKEVAKIVKRARGHHGKEAECREDLENFLMLARYKYLESINANIDLNSLDIGPSNLNMFLSYYLEKLMQDDMITSRLFLNASITDRRAVIISCMTDAIEDSIPISIHRQLMKHKSHRKSNATDMDPPKKVKPKKLFKRQTASNDSQTEKSQENLEDKNELDTDKKPTNEPKPKRTRRIKEVVLDVDHEARGNGTGSSQMHVLQRRLEALEDRERKIRMGKFKASGEDEDFELNTNLSSFM